MKKVIFGASMMVSSFIGIAALMISHAIKVDDGYAYRGMMELIFERTEDAAFFLGCGLLLIIGIVVGVNGLLSKKD